MMGMNLNMSDRKRKHLSISFLMTTVVGIIVLIISITSFCMFIGIYSDAIEKNAVTNSEQTVDQILATVEDYIDNTSQIMSMIDNNIGKEEEKRDDFFANLFAIRSDVVSVTSYNENGEIIDYWAGSNELKTDIISNLSYEELQEDTFYISPPHVESLFINYYPWVVTIAQKTGNGDGEGQQFSMDIRFSSIAGYMNNVGIGQHGYCFIMDEDGNIVYHPQQQLIYSGLKEESTEEIRGLADGSYVFSDTIYSIRSVKNCNWRIVGVSFVDELVTDRVMNMTRMMILFVILVILASILVGRIFAETVSSPADRLVDAMQSFEKDAENFSYEKFEKISVPREIYEISESFGHLVIRVQELMEQVRNEEISLRKTELNALQAQINPHFLYNTLDSIAWMCEEERTQEAVVMVNALAKLFRISISKGHELIPIERECQHAESYLKIQKFRYKSRFSYKFDVQPECMQYLCNKITLQPIIENAIYHGLDMSDEGMITIEVREDGNDIVMSVEDNGVGMSEEMCNEILKREPGDKGGIGIKNVNDRIKIYFGEKYGITIISVPDEGTRVDIRMPKVLEGEFNAK